MPGTEISITISCPLGAVLLTYAEYVYLYSISTAPHLVFFSKLTHTNQ